ncbi:MAG: GAF domain-containing protein [Acidobacteriaceae bacterium]
MNDQAWLEDYIRESGAIAGTVHRTEEGGLRLTASQNIPPKVCEVVAWVPAGKGMAGQALVTAKPVSTCNLKDDPSAAVRPGARAVDAQAAVALPVADAEGRVMAVVGIAWADSRDLSPGEIDQLTARAASIL